MAKKRKRKKSKKGKRPQVEIRGDQVRGEKRVIHHVGGSYIEGDVSMKGRGDFVGRDQKSIDVDASMHIQTSFRSIYHHITTRPQTSEADRANIKAAVKEIENEAKKGERANKSFLSKRLKNLQKMAPDIWEVVLATLVNPAAGLGTIMSKITKRMADEAKDRTPNK